MDLKEFTDPLPKPWLNINANSINAASFTTSAITADSVNARVSVIGLPLGLNSVTSVSGAGAVALSAAEFVNGLLVIEAGRSANISAPLSSAIDALIGPPFAVPGLVIQLYVVNKEPTNALALTSTEWINQNFPKAQGVGVCTTTTMWFVRSIGGTYIPQNTP